MNERVNPFKKLQKPGKHVKRIVIGAAGLVIIAGLAGDATYQIQEQEQAVLTTFGVPKAVAETGLHFKIPFIQKVQKVNTTIQGFPIGYSMGDNSVVENEGIMITSDYNFIDVDFFVEYRILEPVKYLYNSEEPEDILKNISQSCIRTVIASYDVDEVLTTGKGEIQSKIKEMILKQMEEQDLGIQLVNITIQDSEPPTQEVMKAFKAVETAKQGKETALNNANKYRNEKLPEAEAEADQIIQDAEAQKKAADFANKVHAGEITNENGEKFTTVVQIGIGGSDLGPRALYIALENWAKANNTSKMEAKFISNVDPDDAAAVLASVDLAHALFIVVSKSGTTLETLTNEAFVKNALVKAGLNPSKHMLAVTSETSPLAKSEDYLTAIFMDDYIGGRYSSVSGVGGAILSLAFGPEVFAQILDGAAAEDKLATNKNILENPDMLDALIGVYERNVQGYPATAVLPYSQALSRFPAHLQQCDMESNGKSVNRFGEPVDYVTGPVIFGEPGTNGQHSFYQLLHQGTDIVPVIPGFYGAGEDGKVKTFSRGGSDVTGSLVAKAIKADLYENWTDVSGFLVTDPRIVKNPEVIESITYRELRELSYMGATVLHEDAIFPVRKEGIPINIKNTNRPEDKGTFIVESTCKKAEIYNYRYCR